MYKGPAQPTLPHPEKQAALKTDLKKARHPRHLAKATPMKKAPVAAVAIHATLPDRKRAKLPEQAARRQQRPQEMRTAME
jgi:hypothetical protein